MADAVKPAPGTPTQVAHPGRTTLRTIIQTAIPAILTFVVIVPELIEAVLAEPSIPDELRAILGGVAAGVIAVAGIIARIMAIPGVESWLQKMKVGTGVEKEPEVVPEVDDEDRGAPLTEGIDHEGVEAIDPLPVVRDEDGRHRGDYLGG